MSDCCEARVQLVASKVRPLLFNYEHRIVPFRRDQELRWIFEHETTKLFLYFATDAGGTLWCSWLKYCATNQ